MQGYVLGQYGLLYALAHEEQVERLFILNTPLATNSKLRPELAAYKNPIAFLRPGNVSYGCLFCKGSAASGLCCSTALPCFVAAEQLSVCSTPWQEVKAGRNSRQDLGVVRIGRWSSLTAVLLFLLACLVSFLTCRSLLMEPCTT
jgi:hypothetical protein